jgi:hypothetical protein
MYKTSPIENTLPLTPKKEKTSIGKGWKKG